MSRLRLSFSATDVVAVGMTPSLAVRTVRLVRPELSRPDLRVRIYSSWNDVPQADREALKPLYDEGDIARFEQFGGYVGYRVVMLADGDWTAFVAGD